MAICIDRMGRRGLEATCNIPIVEPISPHHGGSGS
jgi:hypothetical protein